MSGIERTVKQDLVEPLKPTKKERIMRAIKDEALCFTEMFTSGYIFTICTPARADFFKGKRL